METILDAPWIERAERTGYPDGLRPVACTQCGEAAEWFVPFGRYFCRRCALELAEVSREDYLVETRDELEKLETIGGNALLAWAGYREVGG